MKLQIIQHIMPVDTAGAFDPVEPKLKYEYKINGEVVPPRLAAILELGLEVYTERYLKGLDEEIEFIRQLKKGE